MLIDYHLHTVYSHHAVGTIDDYLRRAKELGIQEVCFTEHISRRYLSEELKRRLPYTWMREEELELYLTGCKGCGRKDLFERPGRSGDRLFRRLRTGTGEILSLPTHRLRAGGCASASHVQI